MRNIALILIVLCIGCKKENDDNGHVCRWGLCPYKGISIEQYKVKAEEIEGSDGYYIDLLHLQHPGLDYDQLEELLFGKPAIQILKQTTDERGLTSIVYVTVNNDTLALDYLDKKEIDSLTNK